jgi:hypothetical protein
MGDAPCPGCGSLLWFVRGPRRTVLTADEDRLDRVLGEKFGLSTKDLMEGRWPSGIDSLDVVELVLALEETEL